MFTFDGERPGYSEHLGQHSSPWHTEGRRQPFVFDNVMPTMQNTIFCLSTIHSPHLQSFFTNAQQPFPTNGLEKIDTDSHSNDKMHLLITFKGGKKLFIEL